MERVLVQHEYATLGKAGRGLLRRYIEKMTGQSRAQTTRLAARYTATGAVKPTVYRRRRFPIRYTRGGVELLAHVDEARERLSGSATRRICAREHTVHQGDPRDGDRGVYHINAVDEVTQWQVPAAAERISEAHLLPVLEQMIAQFSFKIHGFHTGNGSEFINRTVAQRLEKLRIAQTKSRPRQSGGNGLVEIKNGAVIRKHIGYGYIASGHAAQLNAFYRDFLAPCLNYPTAPAPGPHRQPHETCGPSHERHRGRRCMQNAKDQLFALWRKAA